MITPLFFFPTLFHEQETSSLKLFPLLRAQSAPLTVMASSKDSVSALKVCECSTERKGSALIKDYQEIGEEG